MSKVHYDIHEHRFAQAATLTQALAARIAEALQSGLAAGRGASLAVPGGHTPIALFERLSSATLDWDSVWITVTDERWVDVTSASSNEALVRTHLLRHAAASAQFVGLKSAGTDVQTAASASWSNVAEIPRPFDLMLLGMGDDGHVASLFPDSPGLPAALDLSQPPGCVAMHAPVAPHCESMTQVPQVPVTQACPPPHWLFAVQATHAPAMQASSVACPCPNWLVKTQSA